MGVGVEPVPGVTTRVFRAQLCHSFISSLALDKLLNFLTLEIPCWQNGDANGSTDLDALGKL